MNLKTYQKASLNTLRRFFEEARVVGPKAAYERLTAEPALAARLRGFVAGYKPIKALPDVPYVCLRLPTGGGKTILAAHAITVAKEAWIEKDFPLVLWLVPTNTIRTQTAEALKNPRHPYRRVLDEAFEGRVRVFDISEFTHLTPHDLRSNLCVVVGTIQTLRVTNTDGRKVYAHHELLEPHFATVPPNMPGVERDARGGIRYSFANVMHVHRPLILMDEAHKAGSDLSQEVYERIRPSALIEFTATPKGFNNLLHTVSAQELKDEDMIKMPVVLSGAETWQTAVNSAIVKRAELQALADRDREGYIRPIVLFQAQKKGEEVTVEVLKKHLIENEQIDERKIAIATGAQRELDGIDLFQPNCPIEYVITIEALKEGWDCSFAYVFCSVANISSSTDAEQLLGRVLRMPYAQRRKEPALNKAYARLVSKNFMDAANALMDKLVSMGFDESEAQANIETEHLWHQEDLFGRPSRPALLVEVDVPEEVFAGLNTIAPDKIAVRTGEDGQTRIAVSGRLHPEEEAQVYQIVPEHLHAVVREQLDAFNVKHPPSPAERGEPFVVPRLMASVQGQLVFGEIDSLMEHHEWSLAQHPARLTEAEFSIIETSQSVEIDLNGSRLTIMNADPAEQLALDIVVEDWTPNALVRWLDGKVRDPGIRQAELLAWLSDVVTFLLRDRRIPLTQLMRCKFILARALNEKLRSIRQQERSAVFQSSLFGPQADLSVSYPHGFRFFDGMYADVAPYRGRYTFRKHFLGPTRVPAFDGLDGGEEIICAFALDGLPGLDFWLRNVSRHRHSFFLSTSTDKFYPDFIAQMVDGRQLIVEYKGKDRTPEESRDSREKLLIGQTWAHATAGRGLFVMATMEYRNPQEITKQILAALEK